MEVQHEKVAAADGQLPEFSSILGQLPESDNEKTSLTSLKLLISNIDAGVVIGVRRLLF